jgi:hypothetical protein
MSGPDWQKDNMVIGEVLRTVYRTDKAFDKHHVLDYDHKSGEGLNGNGRRAQLTDEQPVLLFDSLNKKISFAGGHYVVRPEGIVK